MKKDESAKVLDKIKNKYNIPIDKRSNERPSSRIESNRDRPSSKISGVAKKK